MYYNEYFRSFETKIRRGNCCFVDGCSPMMAVFIAGLPCTIMTASLSLWLVHCHTSFDAIHTLLLNFWVLAPLMFSVSRVLSINVHNPTQATQNFLLVCVQQKVVSAVSSYLTYYFKPDSISFFTCSICYVIHVISAGTINWLIHNLWDSHRTIK